MILASAAIWYLTFAWSHGGGGSSATSSLTSCLNTAAREYELNGAKFMDATGKCTSDKGDTVTFTYYTLDLVRRVHAATPDVK